MFGSGFRGRTTNDASLSIPDSFSVIAGRCRAACRGCVVIPMRTITPDQMAWVREQVVAGVSFKLAASRLGHRRGRKISAQTLTRHYWYAMEHGLAAWTDTVGV